MGLNVKNISYRYGKREIVNDVSFSVGEDEIITLFGPSGVGKTTILKMIVGMLTPQTGTIEFTGESTPENTLLVFQDYLLFPHMTVAENIAFGLKMRHVARTEVTQRVQEMVAEFQLGGLEKQYPAQLSGGQQQRVALARAIILRPKLLLLDEPFSSLDSNLRQQMYEYLRRLQAHYHFGVIMVSHDQQETFLLSTRVVVLANQRVQQVASPQELYAHPANRTVADFLGSFNYLTGEANGESFEVAACLRLAYAAPGFFYRFLATSSNWRARHLGLIFGDQSLFVRRTVYQQVGGFPDVPLMEDWILSRKLARRGLLKQLPDRIIASSRKYDRHPWRVHFKLMWIKVLFICGVSPQKLAQIYYRKDR